MILPLRVFGSIATNEQLADDGHRPELLADGRQDLAAQLVRRLMADLEDDERGDDFAAQLVRRRRHAGLGDGRVSQEGRLDLDRADPMAGDLDDLVRATREPDVAVVVDVGRVADVVDRPGSATSSQRRSAPARPRAWQ